MLEIRTLGGLSIKQDGETLPPFDARKVEALLVYLACTGRPQSREVLADLLWDELSQSRALANLRVVLDSLRQRLAPYLEITRTTVALGPEGDPSLTSGQNIWLDRAELEESLSDVREGGGITSPAAAEQVQDAVALYKGEFLQGFYARDCQRFQEWHLMEQERLRGMVVQALQDLAGYHLQAGAYDAALLHARRLLELDPLLEVAHRGVMLALAYSGQRSIALAQYETCRSVLMEELGVEPEAETTALYQRILAGEIAAPAEATGPPPQNLPPQVTPFVGREAVLSEIGERLEDPVCRLLTLVGPGGSGKTRLALEAAERQLEHYPQGVFFVSLAPLNSAESIVPTVAEAVGFTFYPGGEPQQQLLNYLRAKRMLLLLDNYEHLLEGAGVVSEVLKTAPEVKVLVTSRARLNVGGEHRYQVTGMDYPDAEQMGNLREDAVQSIRSAQEALHYSAVKLFLQGARRALPGFELTEENLSDVVQICHLVEGMPLAIRLAASWVDTLTVAQIASEITQSLDLLETELLDVPERQRSVRATINHSSLAKICGNSKTAMS